jgi:hypothetical protein
VSCKTVGSENFASDRPDKLPVSIILAETKETKKSALRLFGRNYCCH